MTTFDELGVPPAMVERLRSTGITSPTPIQTASIPDAMAGRDILGRAPTGSGKTLAFGIPVLAGLPKAEPHHPTALVLAPTRELADQIASALIPLAKTERRWILAVYGGVGYGAQRTSLRRGTDVLVATPGRLADLIDQGSVSLDRVTVVVVDEADRMSDMGFMPQVRHLLDMTPTHRQTLMFSATLDGEVAELTRRYQRDPIAHEVAGDDDHGDAAHYFWLLDRSERISMTARIADSSMPSIVFTRTRRGADRVARQLQGAGVASTAIHGGRSQNQRTRALAAFSSGKVSALVATDVAARGIHVDDVASVVHFDLPASGKDYLHRSGRTARAGSSGVVVSLVSPDQMHEARTIQRSVGLEQVMHDPGTDWLTGRDGGRLSGEPTPPPRGGNGHGGQRSRRRTNGRSRRR